MKLYSRGQVILFSVFTSAVVFIIFNGIIFLMNGGGRANNADASQKTEILEGVEDFKLKTSHGLSDNILAVGTSNIYSEDELNNIQIYEQLNKAVVNITTEIVALNWFLEPVPKKGGSGSGSIIDIRGYVLTNKHVVENAYKVYITLADGDQYEGEVIGTDNENDLAIVKFDPGDKDLVTIPLGDSADIKVGQKVLAIGNPFGYERTLTTGVISGLGRPIRPTNSGKFIIRDMIQTDTSINPGNSGGPLINSQAQMIGINTMIYSPSGGSVGIGFAVPVNTARRVVADLIKYGYVRRGWIDIDSMIQLFPELIRYARISVEKGLLVSEVKKNGNADKAGICGGDKLVQYGRSKFFIGGDIITEVDGVEIKTLSDYYSALEDNKPGENVSIKIVRKGKEKELSIILSERKK